ncbi:MAG TPA: tetratricopeptide repeat protein [Pyrinomonadaceae bacterium]|nr:tetratricopeptide repeat protein [Pyrinomonadaceae bacterium]
MSEKNGHRYEFGDFRLESERPSLWRDDTLVSLPPKALEVLLLLVCRRDVIVTREELLNTVWRDTFVEEGNINYTVSLLRKTLDKDNKSRFIQTVPKRGYRFVADVLEVKANGHDKNAVENVEAAIPIEQPRPKVPWHLIGIVLLGVLLVTGFVIWPNLDARKRNHVANRRHTDNPEAFRAYVRGRAILDAKNPDNFEKAIDEFQKAVALDPTFALAYAGLADASTRRGFNMSGSSAQEFYATSKAFAQKALSLDPETPEAYAALGTVKRIYDWDWTGAEGDFKRAIELNPNYARAHLGYALLLSSLGRGDEALVEIKRAREIDPLSQDVKGGYLTVLEGRGEYAEALAQAEENVKFNKEYRRGLRGVATFLFHLGQYPQVIEISEQELTAKNSQTFVWLSLLVTSHHRSGQTEKRDERLKQLEQLAQTDTKALYALAENYAELGRTDEALTALEKCIDVREERMMWLKVEPRFANLKGNVRFDEILRRMNLANN